MYLVALKTLLTKAVRETFDNDYPIAEFRGLHASIEFPIKQQDYPGIWVDYSPIGPIRIAGVGHVEQEVGGGGLAREFTRWRFQGESSFTLVALTSLERDRLHDEMVRVLAFGRENAGTSDFRDYIQDNEYLAVGMKFDEVSVRGMANSLGTPWQTDDMIYEVEIAVETFGEFVADSLTFDLAPISAINTYPYADTEVDPTTSDDGPWI